MSFRPRRSALVTDPHPFEWDGNPPSVEGHGQRMCAHCPLPENNRHHQDVPPRLPFDDDRPRRADVDG